MSIALLNSRIISKPSLYCFFRLDKRDTLSYSTITIEMQVDSTFHSNFMNIKYRFSYIKR